MPWENIKVEHQRKKVIEAYIQGHSKITDICKLFGISTKTGYKWYNRFLKHGEK